jgi:hypothetical protein
MFNTDIITLLRKRPFEPFRIQVSDGTTYDVRHPDMIIPTPTAAFIGIPATAQATDCARVEIVAMEHLVKLLPLPAVNASA